MSRKRTEGAELSATKLADALDAAIASEKTAEQAVLYLLHQCNFNLRDLEARLQVMEKGLNVSFSRVTYDMVAKYVGLDPNLEFNDAPMFDIQRARLPISLYKAVMGDIFVLSQQYGLPSQHQNEEARSRFLAPLFNRIVAQFRMQFRNTLESIIEGRIATKGRIEYHFHVLGGLHILFVEIKPQLGLGRERQDMRAQVIAEADACDFANQRAGINVPILCILCDGEKFEFFRFDSSTKPTSTFSRGVLQRSDGKTSILSVAAPEFSPSAFVLSLRPVCEVIYYFFLLGYEQGLNAYYSRSDALSKVQKASRSSTSGWLEAMRLASKALELALGAGREAENKRFSRANDMAAEAVLNVSKSIDALPESFQRKESDALSWWDEEMVEAA